MQRSSLALIAFAHLLPLAAGCGDDTDAVWQEGYDEGYAAGKDEVDDLAATVAGLQAALDDLREEFDANGAADLEQQAEIDEIQADYLTSADLAGFATEAWVQEQAYLTADALEPYATTDWVAGQAYLTSTDLLTYATQDWVAGRGFASEFDLELVDGRVAAIEADYLTSADLVGLATESWVTGLGYALDADMDLVEGRMEAMEDDVGALDLDAFVQLIDTDTTIAVTTSTELSDAIANLDGYLIAADATVTIELAAGTYLFTSPIEVRHPNGANIEIVGDEVHPSRVTLDFAASDGFVVADGYSLGLISGVSLQGDGATADTAGIAALNGARVGLGYLDISGFHVWLLVDGGALGAAGEGVVAAGYPLDWLLAHDNLSEGVLATWGSVALVQGASAEDNGGDGLKVEWGGVGDARYATSVRNGNGVSSYNGATVDASHSTVSDSAGNGFAAWGNGYVNAASSSISGSGGWALSAWGMSRVYGYAATSTGNVGSLKSHWASNVYFQSGTSSGNDYSFYQWGNGYIGAPSASFSDSASTYASGANELTDLIYY